MSPISKMYRAYFFDAKHRVLTSDWLEADCDERALTKLEAANHVTKFELWTATGWSPPWMRSGAKRQPSRYCAVGSTTSTRAVAWPVSVSDMSPLVPPSLSAT